MTFRNAITVFLNFFLLFLFILNCSNKNSVNSPDEDNSKLIISFPLNQSVVSGIVTIRVNITGKLTIDKTEFYIDDNSEYVTTSQPPEYNWSTLKYQNDTYHILFAKGYYQNTLIATSETVTVKVNNASTSQDSISPTIQINSPSNGDEVSGNITVRITAWDNNGIKEIKLFIDNNFVSSNDTYIWNTTDYSDGNHVLYAKAWDYAGNEATSDFISVTVKNSTQPPVVDNTPPSSIINYPINNSIVSGKITVNGSATDNEKLKNVYLYIDGKLKHYSTDLTGKSTTIYYD